MGSENEIFEHWDPREEDYKDPTFSTYKEGPGKNISRSLSSASGSSTEPIGLYIRRVPLNFTVESLASLLGKYGSIVSTRILLPNRQYLYSTTAVAIVKVKSMRDALSVIENVNKKPPLSLGVELALTHGDKMQRNATSTMAPSTTDQIKPIVSGSGISGNGYIQHQPTPNSPVKSSAGRGKFLLQSQERNVQELRKPGSIRSLTNGLVNSSSKESESCSSSQSAESSSLAPTPSTTSAVATLPSPASSGAKILSNGLLPPRPPNCIRCNYLGSKRCSVCKAWYCSKKCQEDDWYYHRDKCEPPPPLEDVLLDALGLRENEPPSCKAHSIPANHRDDVVWPRMVKCIEEKVITSPAGEVSSDQRVFTPLVKVEKFLDEKGHKLVRTTKVEEFSKERHLSLTNGGELFEEREQIQSPNKDSSLFEERLKNPMSQGESFYKESHQTLFREVERSSELKNEAQVNRVMEFLTHRQSISPSKIDGSQELRPNNPPVELSTCSFQKQETSHPELNGFPSQDTEPKQQTLSPKGDTFTEPRQQTPPLKMDTFAEPKQQTTPSKVDPIEEPKGQSSPSKVHTFIEPMQQTIPPKLEGRGNDHRQTSPDEVVQSFSNVTTHLKPECIFDAVVTFSKSRESFFVMLLNDFSDQVLLTHPKELESGESLLISQTKIGDVIMALSPSDNTWYRAMVCQLPDPHCARVCYIDFGNDELVTTIKTLPKRLDTFFIPGLALKTTLHSDLPTEKVSKLETFIQPEAQITFRVIEKNAQCIHVAMMDGSKNDVAQFIMQPCVFSCLEEIRQQKSDFQSPPKTEPENKVTHKHADSGVQSQKILHQNLRTKLVEVGKVYTVTPTWLEQDGLYIQEYSQEEMELMQQLIRSVEQHCSKAPQPCNLIEGELVCAFVSEDDAWYRCQVTGVDEEQKQAKVHFFDFGNTDSIAFVNLRTFAPFLTTIPVMALNSQPISPDGTPASYKQMQTIMKPYIENSLTFLVEVEALEPLRVKLMDMNKVPLLKSPTGLSKPKTCVTGVDKSPGTDAVTLLKSGSVKPLLCMYDECESTSLPLENGVEVVILQPTNPLSIFLIAKAHIDLFEKLEMLSTEMNKYCNSFDTTYYIPKGGEVCLAKYAADGLWYRAATISVEDKSALVIFVDYGNMDWVPFGSLCQMVDRFLQLPLIALHCQLKGFSVKEVEESNAQWEKTLHKIIPPYSMLTINVLSKCEESSVYIVEIPSLPFDELRRKLTL